MEFAVGNVNESRDVAVQIKKGMEFYGRFCSSETGPRKQVKTEVYCGGIQCVDSVLDIKPEVLVMIEFSGFTDETLREIRIDAPVAILVRDGKSTA